MIDPEKAVVYSALEVAEICGVVNQTAINWIRKGYLKAFMTPGGQYRVYKDNLLKFMEKRNMRIPPYLLKKKVDKKTVLVVDDDIGFNNVLVKYLLKKFDNIETIQAFDGFEAGVLLSDKKPSIVLLDLDLPGVDGFSICEKIHTSKDFGNPVVFIVTGLSGDDVPARVMALGATEVFKKPLNLAEVAAAIAGVM